MISKLLLTGATFLIAGTVLFAQQSPAPKADSAPASPATAVAGLPSAATVLQHFVDVTGGKAAYEAVKSEQATGTFMIAAAGISGTIKVFAATPAKAYAVVDIPGVGKMEEGTDGLVAWENSAIQGARIKSGDEAAAAIREGAMDARTDWTKYYKSAEVTGTETVNGKQCYKVVMTPLTGGPEDDYYDKESGLLIKQSAIYDTPMGKVPVELVMSDYRKQGALMMPFHIEQHLANQQFDTNFDKYEFNVEIPESRFALPPEVKALQK